MKNILLLFVFACFSLFFAQRSDAQCYMRLEDASGFNTDAYQDTLQAAAAKLCAIFDSTGFAGQFKVYDFGFYLHQENTTGGYPEPFAQKIAEVQGLSPYYLLFGKQTDKSGVYTKFWVDLVLPDTGKFACLDLLSSAFRGNLTEKTKIIINEIQSSNPNQPDKYYIAEVGSMDSLRNILIGVFNCCDPTNRPTSCSSCIYTPTQIFNMLEARGFNKIPITVINARTQLRDSSQLLRASPSFIDLSDLDIEIDAQSFDIEKCISGLVSADPSQGNAKGVLTDNDAFCTLDVNQFFNEMNTGQYTFYFWVHVWLDPELNQNYLFFKTTFSENVSNRNLSFYGYAPIADDIIQNVNLGYVKNTIEKIYSKNGYTISVNMTNKMNIEFHDLFNYVEDNPPGDESVLGHSIVNVPPPLSTSGISSSFNYIRYSHLNTYLKDKSIQRNYVLGYLLAHEFLHQILFKSFIFIFDWDRYPNYPFRINNFGCSELPYNNGSTEGHIVASRNLLFPGDGLNGNYPGGEEFALPQDKGTNVPSQKLNFSGNYVPTKNDPDVFSDWEKIMNSHKGLINRCWILRLFEIQNGTTPEDVLFCRKLFTSEIINKDFTQP